MWDDGLRGRPSPTLRCAKNGAPSLVDWRHSIAASSGQSGGVIVGWTLPAASLAWREIIRFMRQRSRVVGGFATPVLFWLLLGSGLGQSFRVGGSTPGGESATGYMEYFFTGSIVMIVLFTAIFSTISTIEDRSEGFLQSVIVSPAARSSIAAGKILGSAVLATLHASVFLALAPLIGFDLSLSKALAMVAILFVLSLGLSGLGFIIAWSMDSTQGFHSVMNLLLLPMWMLSGAAFPASGASSWLATAMGVNPLTYGVTALRRTLEAGHASTDPGGPSWLVSIVVTCAFALLMLAVATWQVSWKRKVA